MPQKSLSRGAPALETLIYEIRGQRVMLDSDLARIYGVPTKAFNQAVKRNVDKFPADFMFGLTAKEAGSLRHSRSQIVTLKRGQNIKYLPYVFTEHGALQAANVLRNRRAVQMSVGACPERSRTGRSRIPQDACLARGQARPGSKTCVVGKRTKEATRCPRGRYRHNFTTSHGYHRSSGPASSAAQAANWF